MTTLKGALGPCARPLAEAVANWRIVAGWRRWVVRRIWPELARALDGLDQGLSDMLGPP